MTIVLGVYSVFKARPNNAHRALAAFSQEPIRNRISPRSKFTLITQNIDGLSPAANKELSDFFPADNLEPVDVIEMHGRLLDVLCTNTDCNHVEFNTTSPICKALAGTEKHIDKSEDQIVDSKDLPRCSKCNGLARPGVVWFGEMPHRLDEIDDLVEHADLCLVIGTSAVVS
jgi:NAD-dependent deacetylase sirtuin 5